ILADYWGLIPEVSLALIPEEGLELLAEDSPALLPEESLERGRGLERDLLGEEVAARQRAALHLVGVLAPDRGDVAVVLADEAMLAPQGQDRGGDLLAAGRGRVVV